ncbi:hypothetical protein [Muriicola marianensis]|uniref:HEPN domain-containing protein n=1 Tax=Muriicola marianensis TaxID=1324801 RepID=A0ABQ1QUE2_9FLAO|nr:hypothetical protein [Muriicola marianensis]GGD46822.1 hypothetical protein GCM10011361_12150 [Muriicola marianensis]
MGDELINSASVLQRAISLDLYHKLLVQLKKDFALANIPFHPREDVTPIELTSLLREKIYVLLMEQFPEYLNLLYIIDVPEKSFSEGDIKDAADMADEAAYLILKREWQKVWFKDSYGGGNS